MIYSLHSQLLYVGYEDIMNFEEALNAEDDRKLGSRLPNYPYMVETVFYREVAKYSDQVQRYLNVFGWENVHVIIFDDFKSDTAHVYRETCKFLGVNSQFDPQFRVVNPNKEVRSKTLRNLLLRDPPLMARKLVRTLMPFRLRREVVMSVAHLNTRYTNRQPMRAELRRRLQAEFTPEIEKLSELLGRDLTDWCRPHQ